MSGIGALFFALAILFLLLSIPWAKQRFGHFERLPHHFGWRGEPTRLGSPTLIVWFLPLFEIAMLLGIAALFVFVPREMQNGNPTVGIVIAALVVTASHAFTLWLVDRWARTQA